MANANSTGSKLTEAIVESLLKGGKTRECDHVLVIGSRELPKLKPLKTKLIYASSDAHAAGAFRGKGYQVVDIPEYIGRRSDRVKTAILSAMSQGLVQNGETLLCALGKKENLAVDTVMLVPAKNFGSGSRKGVLASLPEEMPAELFEVCVQVALRLAREGYEGRALGLMIILGDSTTVMEHSRPLMMNPFQGYAESQRNIFDMPVREAIRAFAMLDGAFIVRNDGTVLAAGRHIQVGEQKLNVPFGLGARHTAAAAATSESNAIAIAVSQSTGTVRVFRGGSIALELEPSGRRENFAPKESVPGEHVVKQTRKALKKTSSQKSKGTSAALKKKSTPSKVKKKAGKRVAKKAVKKATSKAEGQQASKKRSTPPRDSVATASKTRRIKSSKK